MDNLTDFATATRALLDKTDRIHACAAALALEGSVRQLAELRTRLGGRKFRIVVVGEFNRGKSTLINALLGRRFLPTSINPCTALVNVIVGGSEPAAFLVQPSEANGTKRTPVDLSNLERVVTIDGRKGDGEGTDPTAVPYLEITFPSPLTEKSVEIVDTPGLNEDANRARITYDHLLTADAAIFLLSALQACTVTEMEFLDQKILGNELDKVFFVVNHFDHVRRPRDREAVLGRVNQMLVERINSPRIYPTAAAKAVNGLEAGDAAMVAESGVPMLLAEIERFLVQEAGTVALDGAKRRIIRAIRDVRQAIASHRLTLFQPLEDLARRVEQARPRLEDLRRRKEKIRQLVADRRVLVSDMLRADLVTRVQEMGPRIESGLLERHVEQEWRDWSNARLKEEILKGIRSSIEGEVASWIADEQAKLGRHLEILVADLGDEALEIRRALDAIHVDFAGIGESSIDAEEDSREVILKMIAIGGSVLLGNISAGFGAAIGGWKGAVRQLAVSYGSLLALVSLGATGPISIVLWSMGTIAWSLVHERSQLVQNMKKSLLPAARDAVQSLPARLGGSIEAETARLFDDMEERVNRGIEEMIRDLESTIESTVEERRKASDDAGDRLGELDRVEAELLSLEQDLASPRANPVGALP